MHIKEQAMNLDLHPLTVEALDLQYFSHRFRSSMTVQQIMQGASEAMREKIEAIDYELSGAVVHKYGIKLKRCTQNPFTQQENKEIAQLSNIANTLLGSMNGPGALITKNLQFLKDFIVKYGVRIEVSQRYHKYLLNFKYVNFKEAIVFEVLRRCQIFYTIVKERRKSNKQFYLDPLIQCFQTVQNKLSILHPFHQKVLPKKQLRLFDRKNTDKKMKNTLFEAVSNRKYNQVKELISKGASIEQPGINERQNKREMNCSHRACQLGDLQMCRILNSYKVNWQAKEKEGMTPLHYAVQSSSLDLVKFLIEEVRVNKQCRDIQDRAPFYFACTEGDMDIIRYLYDQGCDINNQSSLGRSALSKACYLGLIEVVAFLMKCPGIILETSDGKGRTALHNSVFGPKGGREGHKFGTNEKDSPQCTQLLLQKGFNVNFPDKQMNTPMHVAMSSDGIDSIRVLLAFGGSLSKLNCYGETPLLTGAKFGHIDAVKILRDQFSDILTVKDIFNKNLILLCAKFRQEYSKGINEVFQYSTDELLLMAKRQQPLAEGQNMITNWQKQITYTFGQLLKEHERATVQYKYFTLKCKELDLQVDVPSLDQVKYLFDLIKKNDEKDYLQITEYILFSRPPNQKVEVELAQLQSFVKWILLQNSVKLLEFVGKIQNKLKHFFSVKHQEYQFSFFQCLTSSFFALVPDLKQKVITYCLLQLSINWIDFVGEDNQFNILHLLVRSKKVGSLIQILKVLSGIKLKFITNQYIVDLMKKQDEFEHTKEAKISPLNLLMRKLLIQKDKQGFDPYNLALLLKDASSSKLLQQKLNQQAGFYKSQFDVKDYSMKLQTDPDELNKFIKGFQLDKQLQDLVTFIQNSSSLIQLSSAFSLLSQDFKPEKQISYFSSLWKTCSDRKIVQISDINQVDQLNELKKESVLGMDIEYFYSQGATLISIMQISSPSQDYIIDFLTSAKDHQLNEQFTMAIRSHLVEVAQNSKIMKLMHGSDNDLCIIRSILKLSFINFIDTARVDVQIRKQQNIRGLATLVKEYLNQHMSKDYQVSEWKLRPIPNSMIDYARRDSLVLTSLVSVMLNHLPLNQLKEILIAGCRQAKKNKKTSQPLIRSVQSS